MSNLHQACPRLGGVESLDDRVRACADCGSADIRLARLDDGVVPGYTELMGWVCNRCGHQGPELLFDDEQARQDFEAARAADKDAA